MGVYSGPVTIRVDESQNFTVNYLDRYSAPKTARFQCIHEEEEPDTIPLRVKKRARRESADKSTKNNIEDTETVIVDETCSKSVPRKQLDFEEDDTDKGTVFDSESEDSDDCADSSDFSDDEEEDEFEDGGKPGDIYTCQDGVCVRLNKYEYGWLYRKQDLPKKKQHMLKDNELMVSDYDYLNLDLKHPSVRKWSKEEKEEADSKLILPTSVFLVDESYVKKIHQSYAFRQDNNSSKVDCRSYPISALEAFGAPVMYGPPSNRAISSLLHIKISTQQLSCGRCKEDEKERGKCFACNMEPRSLSYWISYDGERKKIGKTCYKRTLCLMRLRRHASRCSPVVFTFRFIEAVHELTRIHKAASNGARFFFSK